MGTHPTLLFTGASGLVGGWLHRAALARWRAVVVTHRRSAPAPLRRGDRALRVDLLAPGAVEALIDSVAPQAILHAAALASLPACEGDPSLAERLNVEVTRRLARASATAGIHLVHFSTDQVFAGDRIWPPHAPPGYREEESPTPSHVYGRTKVAAEEAVRASGADALILRVALVLAPALAVASAGPGPAGALDMVRLATGEVRLFEDEWRTPLSVLDLARVVDEVLRRRLVGTLHVAGSDRLSRFELGERIAAAFPSAGGKRRLVATRQAESVVARPRDVSLATVRLATEGLPAPQPMDAALAELRAALTVG